MSKLKLGIIGVGNMGSGHLQSVINGECPRIEVTAIADIDKEKLARAGKKLPTAALFDTDGALLSSGLVDAVLIAVPHYDHPTIAIKAFSRGIHVMTEKPAGVFTRQVRQMNEAAEKARVKFAIMFNQRTNPIYARAKEIVGSGQLGELKRLTWIITNWYRTQAYYDSGSWRATWNGEGGGVLLNQAPHNLDLWQWIFGMPRRIRAFGAVGKYHNISVEDDVTIYGEYDSGATAAFITTTGDACGTNRLEISGDAGKLVLENGKLKWWKLKIPEREFCFTSKEGFACPETEYEEFSAPEPDGHPIVLNNFADAVLDGAPLIANGCEGINSLSISNAAYLSSWTDSWAEIPVSEEDFEKRLAKLCAEEKTVKKPSMVSEPAEKLAERWKVRW
ncbi:MAG: Gfo/Idh/MocA family oxidoreductase [Eubacteriales bacterium]|nr:Gfo/Idh/MocA family oxidoreductase [Eubacteriales bacterium]MDD3883174.1 Gfo/Idh/MocA family oxidoreductase [Eubacteriales bacterium]MDD4512443.1 Gfo/Idh/MocA family oxidoreductase [Eubacteriales bacterium]